MKILTFNYEYPPLGGGGGMAHQLIAEELVRRHEVVVITSGFEALPRREVRNGVEIFRGPVLGRRGRPSATLASLLTYPPTAWWQAAQLLRGRTFDLIHAYFAVPTGLGSIPPARWAALPHVLTILGGDIYDPSKRLSPHRVPGLRSVVRTTMNRSDAVVAESEDIRTKAHEHYGIRRDIEIIPLGMRVPDVPSATRHDLGLPEDVFLAVTVGRLVRRKGIDRLLAAFSTVLSSTARLVVVGAGPELDHLRRRSVELGIADRVHFTGWVEETLKWQILRNCNAYVSATMHEGFGLVYLEAMAAGLPVVTFDHGGQTDFLEHDETGYLVPFANENALVRAIERLVRKPEVAARMGAANRLRSEQYRVERCAEAYEKVYARLTVPTGERAPVGIGA